MAITHRMLLIATGGTIAGHVATNNNDKQTPWTVDKLCSLVAPAVTYLDRKHDIDIKVDSCSPCNVDSSNILPQHWTKLSELIKSTYDDYDSFIVTHGTNTLGYTCAALTFAIANSNKPVILTGSQISSGVPRSDSLTNLENAMSLAVWRKGNTPIKGVVAVFGSHIITGSRVKKDSEFDYDAFRSFGSGSLGRIGRTIEINDPNLRKHLGYLRTSAYPEAKVAKDLRCESDFDMRIASLTEFPGMSSDLFITLVEKNDIRGIILRSFGAGDPCIKHLAAFEELKRRDIPVVVTTQVPNGVSSFQVNESGRMLMDRILAIPAYDMCIEAQTAKLGWLLAKKNRGEIDYSQLCTEMVRDLRGEINVVWDEGG